MTFRHYANDGPSKLRINKSLVHLIYNASPVLVISYLSTNLNHRPILSILNMNVVSPPLPTPNTARA